MIKYDNFQFSWINSEKGIILKTDAQYKNKQVRLSMHQTMLVSKITEENYQNVITRAFLYKSFDVYTSARANGMTILNSSWFEENVFMRLKKIKNC